MYDVLSDCCETVLEVSDDVIDVLYADRETDGALMDSDAVEIFLGKL